MKLRLILAAAMIATACTVLMSVYDGNELYKDCSSQEEEQLQWWLLVTV